MMLQRQSPVPSDPCPPRPPSPPSEKMKNVRIDEENVVKTSYKPPREFVVCLGSVMCVFRCECCVCVSVWFACVLVTSGTFGWCVLVHLSLVAPLAGVLVHFGR